MIPIITALQAGRCPALTSLHMTKCQLSVKEGQELGKFLCSQACPKLQELLLDDNPDLGEEGLRPILAAVKDGWRPLLKKLVVEGCSVEEED